MQSIAWKIAAFFIQKTKNKQKKKGIKIPMSNETANAAGYVSVFMCKIIVNPTCSMPERF